MNGFDRFEETSDVSDAKEGQKVEINEDTQHKFDKLMGDDNLQDGNPLSKGGRILELHLAAEEKFKTMFTAADTVNSDAKDTNHAPEQNETAPDEANVPHEPNSKYELNGDIYETDDYGKTYKKNGELLPGTEYTVNGSKYTTDENGNLVSCDSEPQYTEEGSRNLKEQRESGGEERQEDDDGGHIIARILGGSEGSENLVPMRRTINRGDYKKMENEISKALQEGKTVSMHIHLEYDPDSQRPSKIRVTYFIDDVKTEVSFDNDENSTELMDSLDQKISDENYDCLREELEDMKADGHPASVTSVKTEYDSQNNPVKITVGILDESTGIKTYKVYEPRGDK